MAGVRRSGETVTGRLVPSLLALLLVHVPAAVYGRGADVSGNFTAHALNATTAAWADPDSSVTPNATVYGNGRAFNATAAAPNATAASPRTSTTIPNATAHATAEAAINATSAPAADAAASWQHIFQDAGISTTVVVHPTPTTSVALWGHTFVRCRVSSTTYTSSKLEVAWTADMDAWQDQFCDRYMRFENETARLLHAMDAAWVAHHVRKMYDVDPHAEIFSHIKVSYRCLLGRRNSTTGTRGTVREVMAEPIEPLYALLRHPRAWRCPQDQPVWNPAPRSAAAVAAGLPYTRRQLLEDDSISDGGHAHGSSSSGAGGGAIADRLGQQQQQQQQLREASGRQPLRLRVAAGALGALLQLWQWAHDSGRGLSRGGGAGGGGAADHLGAAGAAAARPGGAATQQSVAAASGHGHERSLQGGEHGHSNNGRSLQGAGAELKTSMMDVSFLLLAHESFWRVRYAPRKLYFDLGASNWTDLSQSWLLEAYESRGISFDRILSWEVKPQLGAVTMGQVPARFYHAYQFFNVPAEHGRGDPRNPLEILKRIAEPHDFVVFKLDVDNWPVEYEFLQQIIEDDDIHSRIDELFYENHFAYPGLVKWCWSAAPGSSNLNTTMADAYRLFTRLRKLGIRAHPWP